MGAVMEVDVQDYARQILEAHGPKAVAEVAQKAVACEAKGDTEQAVVWRQVEAALQEMLGPHAS